MFYKKSTKSISRLLRKRNSANLINQNKSGVCVLLYTKNNRRFLATRTTATTSFLFFSSCNKVGLFKKVKCCSYLIKKYCKNPTTGLNDLHNLLCLKFVFGNCKPTRKKGKLHLNHGKWLFFIGLLLQFSFYHIYFFFVICVLFMLYM